MVLDVAKCNLGQVNLRPVLVSSFCYYNYMGCSLCPYQGHLMTCMHSCSLVALHRVSFARYYLLFCSFSAVFLPTLPSSLSQGYIVGSQILVSKYFTEWFSVRVPGGDGLQHCHGYLLPCARALRGSTNLVGTSAQAHLLVINSNLG